MLQHPWLERKFGENLRYTKEEMKARVESKDWKPENFGEDDRVKVEMSKLDESEHEQNQADDELSTYSDQSGGFKAGSDLSSFFDDLDESFTAPQKGHTRRPQVQNVMKRDIAEGRTFNNSFTGPYPEETDHLHVDKGANP